jgi:hypothetical protein
MRRRGLAFCALLALAACTPPRPTLPTGAGTPFAGFDSAYDEAVQGCRSTRSVLAELALSGRAGRTKLRGRISAGILAPDAIRLEGVAFGRPIFILAGRGERATLLLPRDDRVVRDEPPAAIVEALTGVALGPADLLAVVSGCGLGAATATSGRTFNDEWAAVDTGDTTTYLRRVDGAWRIGAAVRGDLQVLYGDYSRGAPTVVFLKTGEVADIRLGISDLEFDSTIDAKAFEVDPSGAAPMTLDELRRAGPLGERSGG